MKKSIAIIGLSRFGLALVEDFSKLNVDLVAIDVDEQNVKRAGEIIRNVLIADATNIESLKACGISNVDHVIVAIGQNVRSNLTASIIIINNLTKLGVKNITARADEKEYEEIFNLVGATNVIFPLSLASQRLANKIAFGKLVDYFNIKHDFDIVELKVPESFLETTLIDFDIRGKFKLNILLIERNGEPIIPDRNTKIMPQDDIFIFGKKKDIPHIIALFGK